jgi:hypothetical protein
MPANWTADLLLLVGIVWFALGALIIIERARHDRWLRTLERLRDRLIDSSDSSLAQTTADVSAAQFEQLVLEGLPRHVERATAQALLEGTRRNVVVQIASGRRPADVWARIRAAQVLASARTGIVYYILDGMLRTGDRRLAPAALRLFIQLDDRRSAGLLVRALADGVYARSRVAAAFNALSVDRTDALAPLFDSDEAIVRYWAARLALFLRAQRWIEKLRLLAGDRDHLVRRAAVEAIGALGTTADVGVIVDLFVDPVPIVRAHAVRAAAAFSTPTVMAAVHALLDDHAWMVRAAASDVLATQAPRAV